MRLWHDDVRPAPDDSWYWARTNKAAILFLLLQWQVNVPVEEASFDHDMGLEDADPNDVDSLVLRGRSPDGDGVDLAMALYHLRLTPPKATVHSWNAEGANRMASILREAGSDVTICPYRPPNMEEKVYVAMFPGWPK